jgi:lipoate---protein ligase
MNSPLRVIDTGLMAARRNIAVTAALAELHRDGHCPDTLRFHRYTRSVLIGRHQVLADAVNANFCARNRIEIARRVTGGGAVFMSPGILAWDMVVKRGRFGATRELAAAGICEGFAAGIRRLGLSAHYRPPNTIEVAGHKVCGAAGWFDGPTLAYQGTLIVAFDINEMTGALTCVEEEVTSVSSCVGRVPPMGQIRAALTEGIAEAWRADIAHETLTAQERAFADRLFDEEIGSDAFLLDAGVRAVRAH